MYITLYQNKTLHLSSILLILSSLWSATKQRAPKNISPSWKLENLVRVSLRMSSAQWQHSLLLAGCHFLSWRKRERLQFFYVWFFPAPEHLHWSLFGAPFVDARLGSPWWAWLFCSTLWSAGWQQRSIGIRWHLSMCSGVVWLCLAWEEEFSCSCWWWFSWVFLELGRLSGYSWLHLWWGVIGGCRDYYSFSHVYSAMCFCSSEGSLISSFKLPFPFPH